MNIFKKVIFLKKLITNIIILFLIFNFIMLSFADDEIENVYTKDMEDVIETSAELTEEPKINSRAAIVLDRKSKAILYGKNEETKRPMASTTKIMTSIVIIENKDLNDTVEVSKKAAGTGGSRLGLKAGDKITVRDLLYGLMLRSGNDAAVALAEYAGGSIAGFSELMNQKAEKLGLKNTHFETPHGLDSAEHYTTAYELACLTDYALKNEIFSNIVNTKSISIHINGYPKNLNNTNELLGYLNGVYGVKTGFTNGAGRCLVTAIKRKDLDIICIVLGADTKKDRTQDSIKLIEYSYANFGYIHLQEKVTEEFQNWNNINCNRINMNKANKEDKLELKLQNQNIIYYPIKNGEEDKINIEIEYEDNLQAPIFQNTKIGRILVKYNDQLVEEIEIASNTEVRKKNVKDYLMEFLKGYCDYLKIAV